MKLTIIGAGSVGFTRSLMNDVLLEPALEGVEIHLMDVDAEKLAVASEYVKKLIEVNKCKATVHATTDRAKALNGADAVVATIRVADRETLSANFTIPAKYGFRQTVGDTVGPGGVFYGVHNATVLLSICRDMERLCPNAVFLNYTNPMAISLAVLQKGSSTRSIGLCHSVQGGIHFLANVLGLKWQEMDYCSAGVNHCSWFIRLEHKGKDMYPALFERIKDPAVFAKDTVRFDLMQCFGYYPTESTTHHAEYHPYYLRHDSEIERLNLKKEVNVRGDWYMKRTTESRVGEFKKLMAAPDAMKLRPSVEYCRLILRGFVTDQPERVFGSFLNRGYITNLPPECAVEVPTFVDRNGFHPVPVGALPPGVAARTAALAYHQALAAEAILRKDLTLLRHAILVDPNASATLTTIQIREMTDEMIEANKAYLGGWR